MQCMNFLQESCLSFGVKLYILIILALNYPLLLQHFPQFLSSFSKQDDIIIIYCLLFKLKREKQEILRFTVLTNRSNHHQSLSLEQNFDNIVLCLSQLVNYSVFHVCSLFAYGCGIINLYITILSHQKLTKLKLQFVNKLLFTNAFFFISFLNSKVIPQDVIKCLPNLQSQQLQSTCQSQWILSRSRVPWNTILSQQCQDRLFL